MDKETPVADAVDMGGGAFLEGVNGVLFRQDVQYAEIAAQLLGLPCEKKNRYKFAPLTEGQRPIHSHSDKEGWRPTQSEIDSAVYTVRGNEESSCIVNVMFYLLGCVNFRPFTMDFGPYGDESPGTYSVERPFTCGGCCCCPHTISLKRDGEVIGKVVEDWNCSNWCCRYCEAAYCCKIPYKLQLIENGEIVNRYNITYNLCCFGDHNNFCGATPCCPQMLFNVYNYTSTGVDKSAPAGYIQKTYGDCSFSACIRACCGSAGQYIIEWPEKSTSDEKALFLAAGVLMEYIFFENSGS
jgi:hypothetical protein